MKNNCNESYDILFLKTKNVLAILIELTHCKGSEKTWLSLLVCNFIWNITFRDEKAVGEVYIDDGESMNLELYSHITFQATPGK